MIHPCTELRFKNEDVGHAVYATRDIPYGTIVWTLCSLDQRITAAQRAQLPPASQLMVDFYGYIDSQRDTILCWDHGRYVNHSCAPAMMSVGQEHEIAVRDIAAGEELTCDYGTLNLLKPLECLCGHQNCRSTIDDTELSTTSLSREIDAVVAAAMRATRSVPQPLIPYMRDVAGFAALCSGDAPLPSVRLCDAGSAALIGGGAR